jgi:hypothetical protein
VLPALAALAIVGSFLYRPGDLPAFAICWFRALTGLPCPGCGLTRAFCAISHGEFAAAWKFNPFGFLFYLLAVLLVPWPFIRRRWPRIGRIERHKLVGVWMPIALVVILWAFAIWRMRQQ